MNIKWLEDVTLEVTEDFDEELGEEVEGEASFNEGDVIDVSIIEEHEESVDMQLPNGSMAWNIPMDSFEEVR